MLLSTVNYWIDAFLYCIVATTDSSSLAKHPLQSPDPKHDAGGTKLVGFTLCRHQYITHYYIIRRGLCLSCCNHTSANGSSLQQLFHLLLDGTFSGVFVNHTGQSQWCGRQITPVRSAPIINQVSKLESHGQLQWSSTRRMLALLSVLLHCTIILFSILSHILMPVTSCTLVQVHHALSKIVLQQEAHV